MAFSTSQMPKNFGMGDVENPYTHFRFHCIHIVKNCYSKETVEQHSSSTCDLTRFFGICDVEKAILTFPPHSILSMLILKQKVKSRVNCNDLFLF